MLQHPVSDAVGDLTMHPCQLIRVTFTAERLESLFTLPYPVTEVAGQLLWKMLPPSPFFTHHVDVALIYCLFVSADDDEAQVSAV